MFLLNPYRFGTAAASYDAETTTWESRISALGGSVTTGEKDIADALILAIKAATFNSKVKYLLPFIGSGIAAHRVPLRDTLGVGAAVNTGFVDADCTTAGGVANPTEAAKILDTKVRPSDLGASSSGGMGFVERAIGLGTNVEPMGCYNNAVSSRYVLDLRSNVQSFRWGVPGNSSGDTATAISGHYYGQRSSATSRSLYRNGSQVGTTNTTSDAAAGAGERFIHVMGSHAGTLTYWKGRCGAAYMTDGTLTPTEIAALYALINTYLITPTGR